MKSFLKIFSVIFSACFVFIASTYAWDAENFKLPTSPGTDTVQHEFEVLPSIEKDGWKLSTLVLQPGSRSQGYHGVLTHEGTEIQGQKGEKLETPLGLLQYQGSMDDRPNLWSHSGWVVINPKSDEEKKNFSEEQK